jgi:transposase
MALNLGSPWFVKEIVLDSKSNQLDIYIDFTAGHQFLMADGFCYSAYDTSNQSWQHLNFFQYRCFLHARVPRIKQKDGKTKVQEVPWARPGSGFTLLFEAFSMLLIEHEMPVSKVATTLSVGAGRIWRSFTYWVESAHQKDTISDLVQIGFDETSVKKGHNYITHLVDLKERRVLFATPGKGAECIKLSAQYLDKKGVDLKQVKEICIDMSPAFISGCLTYLPDSKVTFDKFHVVKEVHKAMDELRKQERTGNNLLKGHKYTFLKGKLTPKLRTERDFLMEMFPKLGEGYRLTEMFKEFWEILDPQEAEAYLSYWCDFALEAGIDSFTKVVATIKAHWSGIIRYITSKITNGILEGINTKIQLAKKRARGYTNVTNFINMIYFTCGKLKLEYPKYLSGSAPF